MRQILSAPLRSCTRIITTSVRWKSSESFLTTTNSQYIEYLYKKWQNDPKSVPKSWDVYFGKFNAAAATATEKPASLKVSSNLTTVPSNLMPQQINDHNLLTKPRVRLKSEAEIQGEAFLDHTLHVNSLIRAYQTRGHLIADVDPLGIQNPESKKLRGTSDLPPKVVVREHLKGIHESDFDREFPLGIITAIGGDKKSLPLREIIKRLNKVYCGHLGIEYIYIHDPSVLDWLCNKFERPGAWELESNHRIWIWKNIMKAVTFEHFLAKKFGPEKRFGLEGCESFIVSMNQCLESCADHGVETTVIGMAHRGRLNTLVNVCSKPLHQILTQFKPINIEGLGSGDVKYHLGTYTEKSLERSNKKIHTTIMANPSHLEAVDTVVIGRVRAEQVDKGDAKEGIKSIAILVHGDAAYSGQGICYETMHLTDLPDYTTGGVLHIVINNQIGFTTDPRYSRSSPHCTDVGRVTNAPIFHVHADDPDLVSYCSKVACEYRAEFHNDVVLDIVGYRRNGHNEMDEPMLTQPLMYKRIQSHPNVLKIYSDKLLKEGLIDEPFIKEEMEKYEAYCTSEFRKAQEISTMQISDWHDVPWTDFFSKQNAKNPIPHTGISKKDILLICQRISEPPANIKVHSMVYRLLNKRQKLIMSEHIDWSMGECLAFLSLLKDGHHVRLSGEDVERGTFSHRMHIIHDQERDKTWVNMLNNVFPNQALYTVSNSSLSEFGVCGFELGYSTYKHNSLVIWEAQFGDFANSCQVIIDNLLCSGQSKWGRQVGLVILLPHGMEGQGPEHSSARLERFLQLCDDDVGDYEVNENLENASTQQLFYINWIVCNLTTPSNLFHVLRRQILMPFRKPLVIMTPKSLLRHPMVQSTFDEIGPDTHFEALIADTIAKPESVKKVILCAGKIYYELVTERKARNLQDQIAILRVEQLCPFPYHSVSQQIANYPNSKVMWVQEEHMNQGGYHYVRDRIAFALKIPLDNVEYAGRASSSSPATGSKIIFDNETRSLLDAAMKLN
ncbi:PREDICTED: 2-oxoglutarate dehydrogenase, mitochondrial-like [Ceratosolen solmsi marchali]|uniref:2-oxoglutarate dehydrogenase, mitochondrial n=1 Tax=Ceratosolen solmsi marchali TaxID=326594 RepID=A0AAJ6YP49_9HYME|nr:PREDICTED: 2-oxoglutarate dehydrogenase, mitochondrial-like [Ceratosolen solmsi marchali]